ncbi:MAG: hypothetical protein MAG431_01631 [Chloroflexi bacterium]|nr:hypothetical protein [Chloroflexota bacterium]
MNRWKRLFFYLLLNVFVSAVTILSVLFLWENTSLKNVLILPEENALQQKQNGEKTTAAPEREETNSVIKIIAASGVENLNTEYIRIKHVGEEPEQTISLLHWRLRDASGQELDISAHSNLQSLELHSNGAIDIYTKSGTSSPIELYLGLDEPLWAHGETVTLLDEEGNVQDTYLIP